MKNGKAAVIGAGSTYTPELIEGLIARESSLPFREIWLMDPDSAALKAVGGLARRMMESANYRGRLVLSDQLEEALKGADYVFAQIRVGGMAARIRDEKIPLKYGLLGQETTGAGGCVNALRTIPIMIDIAQKLERLSPDAWLINFSNPSGLIAQALLNHTLVRMVGLCNNPVNMLSAVTRAMGRDDYEYDYVGLNHLSWITSVRFQNKEYIHQLVSAVRSDMKNVPEIGYPEALMRAIPALPCAYLSYFYMRDEQLARAAHAEQCRGEICAELTESMLRLYADPGLHEKPAELSKRGGALYSTAAISLVDAIENDKREIHVVNVRNQGAIPFMAEDDVVETRCIVGRDGVKPLPLSNFDNPYIEGMMHAVKAYEKLTVEAALYGDRDKAIAALMVHPLIGDYQRAKNVLDDMLEANRAFLPRFERERAQ